ncbi:MAG: hypothetical protein OEW24_07980 [Chloroflexota bacterium]|nr:hypothetical protein [Chloroflexota bacterium]
MRLDRDSSAFTRAGLIWAASAVLVIIALGWQVLYELGIRACVKDSEGLLMLCAGPLDGWVLPVTLVVAVLLLMVRLLPRRDR